MVKADVLIGIRDETEPGAIRQKIGINTVVETVFA